MSKTTSFAAFVIAVITIPHLAYAQADTAEEASNKHELSDTSLPWFPQENNKAIVENFGEIQGYTDITWTQDVTWDQVR